MMAETIQRSIFDFQDRILPKVVKTITMTDWDGNEDRIMPEDAEAIISAIHGKLTTGGTNPRFMVHHRNYNPMNRQDEDITYISYWQMNASYYLAVDYITGDVLEQYIRVCKPTYVNGHEVGTTKRTPMDARIENGLLYIECDDGNTYTAIIDEYAVTNRYDIKRFNPEEDTEHLLLHIFIQGARGDELLPVMTYGAVFLTELYGRYEQDCQIQDVARKYGIDLKMPVTVEPWAPEHYPIQETCKNCSRWQKDRKACQVQGAINTPTSGNSWCHWHWNGQPFKKVKAKKDIEDEDDYMEECE